MSEKCTQLSHFESLNNIIEISVTIYSKENIRGKRLHINSIISLCA